MKKNLWRKQMLILEPDDLSSRLSEWHGGQSSYVYALSSWGQNHLVSASMIDSAMMELRKDLAKVRGKAKAHLKRVIGDLELVRSYWYENTAKRAGMDVDEYQYDQRNYDTSEQDERMFSREMVQFGGKDEGDLGCHCK
jgi:hypothetical protein